MSIKIETQFLNLVFSWRLRLVGFPCPPLSSLHCFFLSFLGRFYKRILDCMNSQANGTFSFLLCVFFYLRIYIVTNIFVSKLRKLDYNIFFLSFVLYMYAGGYAARTFVEHRGGGLCKSDRTKLEGFWEQVLYNFRKILELYITCLQHLL